MKELERLISKQNMILESIENKINNMETYMYRIEEILRGWVGEGIDVNILKEDNGA